MKPSFFVLLLTVVIPLSGCFELPKTMDMEQISVAKLSYEGCNYLMFKRMGDGATSVVLNPKHQPESCHNQGEPL